MALQPDIAAVATKIAIAGSHYIAHTFDAYTAQGRLHWKELTLELRKLVLIYFVIAASGGIADARR